MYYTEQGKQMQMPHSAKLDTEGLCGIGHQRGPVHLEGPQASCSFVATN